MHVGFNYKDIDLSTVVGGHEAKALPETCRTKRGVYNRFIGYHLSMVVVGGHEAKVLPETFCLSKPHRTDRDTGIRQVTEREQKHVFAGKEFVGSRENFLLERNVSGAEKTFCCRGMCREQRILFAAEEWVGSRECFFLERNGSGAEKTFCWKGMCREQRISLSQKFSQHGEEDSMRKN